MVDVKMDAMPVVMVHILIHLFYLYASTVVWSTLFRHYFQILHKLFLSLMNKGVQIWKGRILSANIWFQCGEGNFSLFRMTVESACFGNVP
mgnify:CR=1 FL=1